VGQPGPTARHVQTEDGDVEIGDIIVGLDGQKVSTTTISTARWTSIRSAIQQRGIYRDGRQMTVPVN